MKGYCNKRGFPIAVTWLSYLEPFTIIERFNSVIRGICNYYVGFINNKSSIQRWIYILKFSCYKTLACKYHTSVSKIIKRFYAKDNFMGKSIEVSYTITYQGCHFMKKWALLTYLQAADNALSLDLYEIVKAKKPIGIV